ncbi:MULTISPECIES: hypothetical protein [unclassified Nonomuraea]|uniref:hypothetical protein n=1 Tax=unclassified Nonomuraea TaxID=2593643 RepID=UPI00340ADE40
MPVLLPDVLPWLPVRLDGVAASALTVPARGDRPRDPTWNGLRSWSEAVAPIRNLSSAAHQQSRQLAVGDQVLRQIKNMLTEAADR